ncbi:response regulator transcription factor [Alkalihalobacterium chitinilyticum]|uniref:Response regulator transcription factor n=1 Tax=Alkalihalobacterium chitinilyticum TaxID=2980103 RepID=A0ABT5VD91_9BACI|nr:response regulator transcription factor [Alkalihalobacterium chitinilyticum]MDE5413403.1 response regulator transcription factor [Alkalihalobacterium chitinilyticum]
MKKWKVLIIEDDVNICELISLYIEKQGHIAILSTDGEDGLSKFYDEQPDMIILDIMLPKLDGWQVCKDIRRDNSTIPIIMLTGMGESYDKIRGLDLGADDYIVKPFDPNELIARMKAVMRRVHPLFDEKELIDWPSLAIDMNQYQVLVHGKELTMPPKELELLYFFATHPNQVFSRLQLLDQVWGFDFDGDPRTIDVHVKRLREKLGHPTTQWALKTIRGVGYKFEVTAVD